MNTEVPVEVVVAITTIIASLITAIIALVNLTLSKEQKVSEFRQAWIDGLREDLSKFSSALSFAARNKEASYLYSPSYSSTAFPSTPEQVGMQHLTATEAFYRIKLRLNPCETEHIELLRLLNSALTNFNSINVGSPSSSTTLKALEVISDFARPVLKSEWKRVKQGEPAFTRLRTWMIPVVLLISVGFSLMILFGKFHQSSVVSKAIEVPAKQ